MIGFWVSGVLSVLVSLTLTPGGKPIWRSWAVVSGSMQPTLTEGDVLLFDTQVARSPVERGEIVTFLIPGTQNIDYVKRVIAVGGDRVALHNGQVVLNGAVLPRVATGEVSGEYGRLGRFVETLPGGTRYRILKDAKGGMLDEMAELVVPAGELFVLGDNRDNSQDSRDRVKIGLVPLAKVEGRHPVFSLSPNGLQHLGQAPE